MATRISGEKQQPKWTAFLTELLADLIVDHALKGNRVNNSISNKAWNCISDEFHKQSGLKWNQEHLKNRFSVLRRQYAVVKSLIARQDFIFNESNASVIATAETWHQYVKEYPDAEAIRTGGCPIYKQLSQIFAEDPITSGNHEKPVLLPQAKTEFSSEHDGVSPPTAPKRRRRSSSSGVEAAIANAISEMAAADYCFDAAEEQVLSCRVYQRATSDPRLTREGLFRSTRVLQQPKCKRDILVLEKQLAFGLASVEI